MPLLRKRRSDLQALIGATARERNIDQTFIEKDFWVIEVLRAATTPIDVLAKDGSRYPVRTIFKGGTSLSRAYELIELRGCRPSGVISRCRFQHECA